MTNTQNVTELQPRMTREQLIDAARTAAKYLPVASAQLMNELANRLDITSVVLCEAMAQRKALAEQNTTLRQDVASWAKECDRIVFDHAACGRHRGFDRNRDRTGTFALQLQKMSAAAVFCRFINDLLVSQRERTLQKIRVIQDREDGRHAF